MAFDYGKIKPDGQYENYPTNTDGEFLAPIRNNYIHSKCGSITMCDNKIAETYAINPNFYALTFCAGCRMHYPINEFRWVVDNVELGEIGNKSLAGKDMRNKNNYIK